MASIFKKIKSIDPEDETIISSLGLTPILPTVHDELDPKDRKDSQAPLELTPDTIREIEDTDISAPQDIGQDENIEDSVIEDTIKDSISVPDTQASDTNIVPKDDHKPIITSVTPVASRSAQSRDGTSASDKPSAITAAKPSDSFDAVPGFITRKSYYTDDIDAPSYRWMGWVTALACLGWLITAAIMAFGYFDLGLNLKSLSPVQMTGLALLVLFPVLMLALTGFAFKQLAKVSQQAHNLAKAAQDVSQADVSAVSKTAIMSAAIATEIDGVDARIDMALSRLRTLETTLQTQIKSIAASNLDTETMATKVALTLSEQSVGLENISGLYDARMVDLNKTFNQHMQNLTSVTKTSGQKIEEARVSVEGAAAKINAASDLLRSNSLDAANSLKDSHNEIERLGKIITDRSSDLDTVYRKHATELASMIEQLRDEQENLGVSLEARLSKMRDVSLSAQVSAQSLTKASQSGQETVEALAKAARFTDSAVTQRFAEMEDMVKYSNARAESISETASRRVQNSLAQTRKEISRIETDMAALQNRLQNSATAPQSSPQDIPTLRTKPEKPLPKKRKRRGLLRIKPLENDFPPVEPPRFDDPSPFSITSEVTSKDIPDVVLQYDDLDALNNLELDVEPVDIPKDIVRPDKNAHLTQFDPENTHTPKTSQQTPVSQTLSPPQHPRTHDIPRSAEANTPRIRGRARWNWRGLIPGGDKSYSGTTPTTPPVDGSQHDASQSAHVNETQIIVTLSGMGLTPGAIVDDGCIIEATNARKSKGPMAMSQAISHRLSEPVQHLREALETNMEFKSDMRAFTSQYQARLNAISEDREAIRTKLESETGRAYLLCDAALNG